MSYSHGAHSQEDAVISTNDDAASCKRYAVHKEYWKDNYIQYFVRMMPSRKAPEISRGYYARVEGIRTLLDQFLQKTDLNCQIVSIGAGFDTLFWQLHEAGRAPSRGYYEIDLKPVTARKCMAIKSRRQLHVSFPEGGLVIENDEAHSSLYHLLAADIRHIQQMEQKLASAGLDKSIPTVFFAECVLIYLEPKYAVDLKEWVANNFKTCLFVNYDPVNLNDRFGQVMLDNLQNRQCSLLGASSCPSTEAQEQSFLSTGWEAAKARDMMDIYNRLSKEEITRIEHLEFLDEINLLYDLLRHYCISWASKDAENLGLGQIDF